MPGQNKKRASAGLITIHTPVPVSPLEYMAEAEKSGSENMQISVSDRSCSGNRIPCPSKCGGERKTPSGWLSLGSIRRLQAISENENQEARSITQSMLDTEKGFVKDLDSYLNHRGTLELRKKELLHMRWTGRVWMPIQKNIRDHLLLCGGNEAEKMRSAILHYLEHCNTKGFVSLESYDPTEYDPFLHVINGPCYFKASTPLLEDPLLFQSRERAREMRVVLHCQPGHVYTKEHTEELLKLHPTRAPLSCCYGSSGSLATTSHSGETENIWKPNRIRRLCQTAPERIGPGPLRRGLRNL